MTSGTGKKRDVAILIAKRLDGSVVEHHEVSLEDYYESAHPVIDSDTYRAARDIVLLDGCLFDSAGEVSQTFECRYSVDGKLIGGRTVHADGTVREA